MKIERTKNAKRNIYWGIINKLSSLIFPFAIRTILLYTLGNEYVGLNSLFNSILQVLNLAELGFSSVIIFSMYKPIAEDDINTICALLNFYKRIYKAIGFFVLVVGLLVLPFLPKLINGSYPYDINIYALYCIYLVNTSCSYFLFAYKTSLFYAHQRNDVLLKISTVTLLTQYIFQIILLLVYKNYYIYIVVMLITTITTNLWNAYAAKKYYPNLICCGTLSKDVKYEIKRNVSALVCHKIGGVVVGSIDSIVISSFLGLTILAWYGNYYYILSAIVGVIVIIYNAMTAGIGNSIVKDTVEKNYNDYVVIKSLMDKLISLCSICLLVLYQPFMRLWVGEENVLPNLYTWVFAIYFYIHMIRKINITYRDALGYWRETMWQPIVSSIVNLLINLWLVSIIGLYGVLLSTILCMAFIDLPWEVNVIYRKFFKVSRIKCYISIIINFMQFVALGFITNKVVCLISGEGWIILLLKGVVCFLMPSSYFGLITMINPKCSAERKFIKEKII